MWMDAKVSTYAFQVAPYNLGSHVADNLNNHHLIQSDNWAKVYRQPDMNLHAATDLRIEAIGADHAADFARIVTAAFQMPPFLQPWLMNIVGRTGWQQYLAFDGKTSVGAGALYIKDRIAWLGIASTLGTHRNRGSQRAIMAARIRAAAAAGCDWVITETGEDRPDSPNPSYHNMLHNGFKLAYQRANYIHNTD